ncbi:hypothetical protein SAMN05444365_108113 [Micromonospora pattaloongensis]|uniref:Uncharacterized protein n=1 Tax=Micromonospora pattaloongensis TaxID=405436 RepID=A0A1H3RLI3_9ACTN|nr:hypothetical protein SAMN05444365_108113 [Micromonospora pattaloongensis]
MTGPPRSRRRVDPRDRGGGRHKLAAAEAICEANVLTSV